MIQVGDKLPAATLFEYIEVEGNGCSLGPNAFDVQKETAGKTVAIYDDPAAERWVTQHIPGARVRKFSGDAGWFEALERREADALIYDYPFAAEEIKRHPRTKIVQFNLNQSR